VTAVGFVRAASVREWWREGPSGRRLGLVIGGAVVLAVAVAGCLFAGLSPLLPPILALLLFVALRPFPAMVWVSTVVCVPLGLWLLGLQDLVGEAFGGRDYVLSLSASVVACSALLVTVVRKPPTQRQVLVFLGAGALYAVWVVIGVVHNGIPQTLVGARLTVVPVILLIVLFGLGARELRMLVGWTAFLVIANGVAAIAEYAIGPAKLADYGFKEDLAIRYIGGTFRAPGLTQVNAELGLLAGAYLLGYAALWLVRDLRPRQWYWHVAAGTAAVALALSTSRTGALLLAGGMIAAVALNRGGGPAARKRARIVGVAVVAVVVAGFVAVGATGSSSTFERFQVWGRLLRDGAPWYGAGVGSVGAATVSRASSSPQVFVDNYFVSISLQLGIPVLIALVLLLGWGIVRLSRASAERPEYAVHLAILCGLAAGCMTIEVWEYADAMFCLALFIAYAERAVVPPLPPPDVASAEPDIADTVRLQLNPSAAETLDPSAAETVVMKRPATLDDTVLLINPRQPPERPERYLR
jgi:hypothetical protein